jgi:hypothetical protein
MNSKFPDHIGRAALGIGIGATLAAVVSQTAFAGTVGLADADHIAVNVAAISTSVSLVCLFFHLGRRP